MIAGAWKRRPEWLRNEGAVTPLKPLQIRWLGALLLAAQVPQAVHLPIWVALFGAMLVAVRFALLRRDRQRPAAQPARIPSWALALFAIVLGLAIRQSYEGTLLSRDPCVAMLYVLAGLKFLEARTLRDGTLIVSVAMALLITPFFYGQSMLAAAATVPGILLMGGTLDALARPGAEDFEFEAWGSAMRRTLVMIAQGLPIAILLFVLFPRLAGPLWGVPKNAMATTGLSETMEPGSISALSQSDAVAFRVDFEGNPPPARDRYWRGPVLSRFDGRAWTPLPVRDGALAAETVPGITYTVSLEPTGHRWLFALDLPVTLPKLVGVLPSGPGDDGTFGFVSREQQLVSRAPVSQPLRYRVTSVVRARFAPTTPREADLDRALPPGNPRTVAFARELRAAHPDDADYALAVLRYFRDQPFVYTLSPPRYLGEPVDEFLFGGQRGFCEHYASAFVVLLRAAGIPARVVTGYQGGEVNPRGEYMIVRESDAHAWAEAIIDGEWRRFDPTAAVSPLRIERGLGAALPSGEAVPLLARLDAGWLKTLQLAWDAVNHQWRRNVVDFDFNRQRELWRELALDRYAPWQVVGAVAGVAGVWAMVVLAWLAQKRRRQERALVLWEEVCRRLARAGLARAPHEGPLAYADRAAARWPQFAIAFHAIGQSFATLRYGDAGTRPRERAAMLATLERAIEVLPNSGALRGAPA